MQASEVAFQRVLEGAKQYMVPGYQRHYVWGPQQIDQLWKDIVDLAVRRRDNPAATCFLGPLVVTPAPHTNRAGVERQVLLDGQQRLVTLTLLLAALRDRFTAANERPEADRITYEYLVNQWFVDDRLKIVLTSADRDTYQDSIDQGDVQQDSLITRAFKHLTSRLSDLDDPEVPVDARRLADAITRGISFLVINCGAGDSVQRILTSFENSGHVPGQADLIRNHLELLSPVLGDHHVAEHWMPMQSALSPEQLDSLLWVDAVHTAPSVVRDSTYRAFVTRLDGLATRDEVVGEFRRWSALAKAYRPIIDAQEEPDSAVRRQLRLLTAWGIPALEPALLTLFSLRDSGQVEPVRIARALLLLESFLIRRFVVGDRCLNMDRTLLSCVPALARGGAVDEILHEHLSSALTHFPTDREVYEGVRTVPLAIQGSANQRKLVLQFLSWTYGDDVEADGPPIMHVMPRRLSAEWRSHVAPDLRDAASAQEMHDATVYLLGNLTLNHGSDGVGATFEVVRQLLLSGGLAINGDIERQDRWGRTQIMQRCDDLAGRICRALPGPVDNDQPEVVLSDDHDTAADVQPREPEPVVQEPVRQRTPDRRGAGHLLKDIMTILRPNRVGDSVDEPVVVEEEPVVAASVTADEHVEGADAILNAPTNDPMGRLHDAASDASQVGLDPQQALIAKGVNFDAAGHADPRQRVDAHVLAGLLESEMVPDRPTNAEPTRDDAEREATPQECAIPAVRDVMSEERGTVAAPAEVTVSRLPSEAEETFLQQVALGWSTSVADAVSRLLAYWIERGGTLQFAKARNDSCLLKWPRPDEQSSWPLILYTNGLAEVPMFSLQSRPPFDDEASRQELAARFVATPGITFPLGSQDRWPSFSLEVLGEDAGYRGVLDALAWFIEVQDEGPVPVPEVSEREAAAEPGTDELAEEDAAPEFEIPTPPSSAYSARRFFSELEHHLGCSVVEHLRHVLTHWESLGGRVRYAGGISSSCLLVLPGRDDADVWALKIHASGKAILLPERDIVDQRDADDALDGPFRDRLAAIPGLVNTPESGGFDTFSLEVLEDDACVRGIIGALDWFATTVWGTTSGAAEPSMPESAPVETMEREPVPEPELVLEAVPPEPEGAPPTPDPALSDSARVSLKYLTGPEQGFVTDLVRHQGWDVVKGVRKAFEAWQALGGELHYSGETPTVCLLALPVPDDGQTWVLRVFATGIAELPDVPPVGMASKEVETAYRGLRGHISALPGLVIEQRLGAAASFALEELANPFAARGLVAGLTWFVDVWRRAQAPSTPHLAASKFHVAVPGGHLGVEKESEGTSGPKSVPASMPTPVRPAVDVAPAAVPKPGDPDGSPAIEPFAPLRPEGASTQAPADSGLGEKGLTEAGECHPAETDDAADEAVPLASPVRRHLGPWETYYAWNSAIASTLFPPLDEPKPVYLDIEDEQQEALGAAMGITATGVPDALAQAVLRVLDLRFGHGDVLRGITRNLRTWQQNKDWDTPPPILPFLAVLCLAAERMAAGDGVASTNFYARLRQILDRPDDDKLIEYAYREVGERYWQALDLWLRRLDGVRGLSTISAGKPRYVGYPISQAMIRTADRQRLVAFLENTGLPPGVAMEPAQLIPALDSWIRQVPSPASAHMIKLWESGRETQQRVAESAVTALAAWDGAVAHGTDGHESGGRLVLQLSLTRFPRKRLGLSALAFLPQADQPRTATIEAADGPRDLDITPSIPGALALADSSAIEPVSLLEGQLRINDPLSGKQLIRQPRRLVTFRRDDTTGRWLETPRTMLTEELVLCVHESLVGKVRSLLDEIARPGWEELSDGYSGVPESWTVLTGVQIFGDPGDRIPPGVNDLQALAPLVTTQMTLGGGLRLPSRGRRVWHVGAAPELRAVTDAVGALRIALEEDVETDDLVVVTRTIDQWEAGEAGALTVDLSESELEVGEYRLSLFVGANDEPVTTLRLSLADGTHPNEGLWATAPALQHAASDILNCSEEPTAQDDQPGPMVHGASVFGSVPDHINPRDRAVLPTGPTWSLAHTQTVSRVPVRVTLTDKDSCVYTGAHHIQVEEVPLDEKHRAVVSYVTGRCIKCGLERRYATQWWRLKRDHERRKRQADVRRQVKVADLEQVRRDNNEELAWDLALDALFYAGGGAWSAFERIARFVQPSGIVVDQFARGLEALGHMEIRRSPETLRPLSWEVGPSALVRTSSGRYLAGYWPDELSNEQAALATEDGIDLLTQSNHDGPGSWYLSDMPSQPLEGVIDTGDAARRLCASLPPISQVMSDLPRVPVNPTGQIRWFSPSEARWTAVDDLRLPGAYRMTTFATIDVLRTADDVRAGSMAMATVQLSKHAAPFILNRPPLLAYNPDHQQLWVPLGAELPGLYGRAAVLCSGRLPFKHERSMLYSDVPADVAEHLGYLLSN